MRELLIICALSAVAAAEPSFEVKDRGDAVEVIAHDLAASRTAIAPLRERLEIPLLVRRCRAWCPGTRPSASSRSRTAGSA
jgi:hypothetical protein